MTTQEDKLRAAPRATWLTFIKTKKDFRCIQNQFMCAVQFRGQTEIQVLPISCFRSSNKKALLVAGLTVLATLLIAGQAFTAYSVYQHSEKLSMLERRSDRLQEMTIKARGESAMWGACCIWRRGFSSVHLRLNVFTHQWSDLQHSRNNNFFFLVHSVNGWHVCLFICF